MASSSSTVEEPPISAVVANAPALTTMEAKMIVATGRHNCQELKDVLTKEGPSSMVVVMTSSNKTSTPNPLCSPPFMDPGLLAVACSGSWKKLQSFLIGDPTSRDRTTIRCWCFSWMKRQWFPPSEPGPTPSDGDTRSSAIQQPSQDEEAQIRQAFLEGVTVEGDNFLHVRVGSNEMVTLLMKEDPQLATTIPEDGTSPMYLAILLEHKVIAKTLHEMTTGGVHSYSGPDGQNALHAAVLRGKDLTKMLLGWNNTLTIQQDKNGSTPLHLAACVLAQGGRRLKRERRVIRLLLLKANPNQLYQPDKDGLFPIHVAASVGATLTISDFLKKAPDCAGLRDARGRTFLHVAVDQIKVWTVLCACINQSLSWIWNKQDNNGNTALHLAVKGGDLTIFSALFGNREVHLSLTNEKGKTPLDIARCNLPMEGLYYKQNSEVKIHHALEIAGAKSGICRQDYLETNKIVQARQDEINKREMVKDSTQNLSIGSVLIATVTFGATFAMPGGYRADDHTNGGTPTLAGRYAFDAFIVANALAFTFSVIATAGLMSSGSPMYSLPLRVINMHQAFSAMLISVKCLVAAFALATYIMLAPVAHMTAITVCVLSSLILLYADSDHAVKNGILFPAKCHRIVVNRVLILPVAVLSFICTILLNLWPIVVIFGLSALKYIGRKGEPAAQPPTPLA